MVTSGDVSSPYNLGAVAPKLSLQTILTGAHEVENIYKKETRKKYHLIIFIKKNQYKQEKTNKKYSEGEGYKEVVTRSIFLTCKSRMAEEWLLASANFPEISTLLTTQQTKCDVSHQNYGLTYLDAIQQTIIFFIISFPIFFLC